LLASRDPLGPVMSALEGIRSMVDGVAPDGARARSLAHLHTSGGGGGTRFSSSSSTSSALDHDRNGQVTHPRAIDLDAPPTSLEYSGAARVVSMAPPDASIFKKLLLFMGGYYSKQSAYMRAAKELNACVKEQAADPGLHKAMDIPADSFQHRHALLSLHVWMVLKRLRLEGKPGKKISQIMYDEFQDDVEHMVRQAGVQVRLGKHLSELEKQFYGSSTAYDRAIGSDPPETLAAALWRNVYQGEGGRKAASERLARYAQRGVACLAKTPSAALLEGRISFN
jgi:cytochrome b pre-mRNA-processing protein 3